MNVAIILAGGSGTRVGSDIPKQFISVYGRQVIEYTIDAFEKNSNIDEIAIVCKNEYIENVQRIIERNSYKKVHKILPGGRERYESSLAALNEYNDDDFLIFHDAVRPLVSDRIINDCITALNSYQAIDVAIKTSDTIIQVNDKEFIEKVPVRAFLRNGQTPQCFKRKILKEAYDKALADPLFTTTDDCGVVHKYTPEIPIFVVEGAASNIKITYPEDLSFFEQLINKL